MTQLQNTPATSLATARVRLLAAAVMLLAPLWLFPLLLWTSSTFGFPQIDGMANLGNFIIWIVVIGVISVVGLVWLLVATVQGYPRIDRIFERLGGGRIQKAKRLLGAGILALMFLPLLYLFAAVALSILDRLGRMKRFVRTLTCDRGSEFAEDRVLEEHLKAQVYFADPHSPWQRGGNENFNGLLRQSFPRSRDFSTITALELQTVEDQLNDRPRNGWAT